MRSAIIGLCLALAACSSEAAAPADGTPAVVTVYGDSVKGTRGATDFALEPLFTKYGIAFESAVALSAADLAALPTHEITVRYPLGGDAHVFTGPRLIDVVGGGRDVAVTALDGYQRVLSAEAISTHRPLLAIERDGRPLGLGGFGPAMVVWPRDDDAALADMPDDDWVWGVFAIEVID
jgi:hypothetical protein